MSIALSNATIASVSGRLAVPPYDRSKLTAGIIHIGVGAFHRAHQAVYLTTSSPQAKRLRAAATDRDDRLAFVRDREIFGSLVEDTRFTEPYLQALESLHSTGSRAGLGEVMSLSK